MENVGSITADGGGRRVAIAEWETLSEHLEQFCDGAQFSVDAGLATCEFATARFTVSEDGTVEAGMPLHAFEREGVDSLLFYHDRGEVVVEADDDETHLRYTFRRP
jgi:hypothetical protein